MRKKQKNVPPVTEPKEKELAETEIEQPILRSVGVEPVEYKEPEVAVTEPPKPTAEQRLDQMENFLSQLLERLTPVIQLSDQIKARQEATAQNPQATPAQGIGGGDIGAILQLINQFTGGGGGGDTELAQLGNTYGKMVLKQAIADIGKPSIQERIGDAVLENFIRKKSNEAAKDLE